MNHLSLFSGIGGLDLAAEAAGFRTVAFVERDKFCQRVLAKHWPGVPIFEDVKDVGYASLMQRNGGEYHAGSNSEGTHQVSQSGDASSDGIGLLTGGFPCQPHSVAGKRKASSDERDLWDECVRVASEFKPRWCVFENVPGLLTSERGSFFARILDDLAALGYSVGWGVWGANDVGAPHRRDRIFIVAHTNGAQCKGRRLSIGTQKEHADISGRSWWSVEPGLGRVVAGIPNRVDRLRALGNAVVPQQAYPIFKAIAELENL